MRHPIPAESRVSPEQIEYIVQEVYSGRSVLSVERELGLREGFIFYLSEKDVSLREKISRARSASADALVDKLTTITDDEADVNKARLKSDNIKWLAARLKPTDYGDRVDVNMRHSVDLDSAMQEARQRVAHKTTQLIDITPKTEDDQVLPDVDDIFS